MLAIDTLEAGDIILVELNVPGPRYGFQNRPDQLGYVCMEYFQANYDVILYAWAKGIVVIEPAGNGWEDLDDTAMYGLLFDTTYRNSHALMVGAGYPSSSTDDRERMPYSNHGARVNVQGHGASVHTCGYGSLFDGGGDRNQYYTDGFAGTSSASAIVAGAVACLMGHYQVMYEATMSSDAVRDVLVGTGTAQLGDTSQHIGPRPDLAAAIADLTEPASLCVTPILIDTAVAEGTSLGVGIYLRNRSISDSVGFSITCSDSMPRGNARSWLSVLPESGTVAPEDSQSVTVTIDAGDLEDRLEKYLGMLAIDWALAGDPPDSSLVVPVYVTVPCNDTTYGVMDENDPEGPTFNWISAKTLGSKISGSYFEGGDNPMDNGTAGPRNIGFWFPFYDTTYNRFYVGVNGGISFTDTNLSVNNGYADIDVPGGPFTTFIGPFWSDLIFDTVAVPEAGIYTYNDPAFDTLVIEWYHPGSVDHPMDTSIDFEVVLSRDGGILFQYLCVGDSGMAEIAHVGVSELECRGLDYFEEDGNPEHQVTDLRAVKFFYRDREWVMAGNVDGIGDIDISDLVYLVEYMFNEGPEPIPYSSGDMDCSGGLIDISDLVYLVNYMFSNGPEPCSFLWKQ